MTIGEFSAIKLCLTFMWPDNCCNEVPAGRKKYPCSGLLDDALPGALYLALLSDLNCTTAGFSLLSNINETFLSA